MADSGVSLQGNGHRQVDGAGQPYVDEGEKDGQQLLVQARQVHAARHKARLETTGRLYWRLNWHFLAQSRLYWRLSWHKAASIGTKKPLLL